LEKLVDVAKIQSTEASNKLEGIVTTKSRIKQLVQQKTTPRNRDEREIAGYRDVLNTIHENHDYIPLTPNYILQLHRDLMQYTGERMGGSFKSTPNQIAEKHADGTETVSFQPVAPYETPDYMRNICDAYRKAREGREIDPLILIPSFLVDFLCIHPFDDGNGRMSRLLTMLLLYQTGFDVGKYISIEKHIEKTKNVYYDALEEAGQGWYEGTNNAEPFIKYMLGIVLAAYREFEERVALIQDTEFIETKEDGTQVVRKAKSTAYDIVKAAIETRIGKFTKNEILQICPSVGKTSGENAIRKLVGEGIIQQFCKGRGTYYVRTDALGEK
jgi:Fic family protein